TWQADQGGEPNLLSPYLEMVRALHGLAFGADLLDGELAGMLAAAQVSPADGLADGLIETVTDGGAAGIGQRAMPRPALPASMLPQRISPSGYNSLMACPYQYYARHVLRLNELDEVREELDKRDYGTWVHAVLQRFHAEIPLLQNCSDEQALQVMRRIGDEVFADALAHDYLAQAWLLRWQALIPAYLQWQREHEQQGWRYQAAEQDFSLPVTDGLWLKGRMDRVDAQPDGAGLAVLDYKTQSVTALKGRLKAPGEDVQLACYAGAIGADKSAFVSLDADKVQAVEPVEDIAELARLNRERLATVFEQLRNGVPLPAHGAEKVCGYCEMRGVCRRGEWQAVPPEDGDMRGVKHG
ncbi:MAG: PD-(D/E)XK nuclease family protein, partial [Gallionella sp.]|nr:PD-(D/E)XK nuclease family protein [Gallionella sp.]